MKVENRRGRWIFLSYPLNENSPGYGGGGGGKMSPDKSMAQGDSCNTQQWQLSNHLGTHLDFPRHFIEQGRTIDDYAANFFVFKRIGIIDLGSVAPGEVISSKHLARHELSKNIELLIVKTGFSGKRNLPVYWQHNPGFDPELADTLREKLPVLRILGFDSISLSSFAHRELGRKAHRHFLDHPRPILPLEDMALNEISEFDTIRQLIVAPWRISLADGAPCTVMAEIAGEV
jgi:kynurenine formamidase